MKNNSKNFHTLAAVLLTLVLALPAHTREASKKFKGADMTLYFNGGEEDQVLSSQAVVLVHLPKSGPNESDYDPAHDDIARLAQRLSDNVAIVPVRQIWPVQDETSRRWIRLMRCNFPPKLWPKEKSPLLFFSFAGPSGRSCVIARSSGNQAAQLVEQLLSLEEGNCSFNEDFKSDIFDWASNIRRTQERGHGLIDAGSIHIALQERELLHCEKTSIP